MKMTVFFRLFLCLTIFWAIAIPAASQDNVEKASKILRIQYNDLYQLQDSYTIIYDNAIETAKLNTFRVTFFGPGRQILAQTKTQTYPSSGQIVTYDLEQAITGFNEVELAVLSLHGGDPGAFPANIGSILALNELRTVPVSSPPTPVPPDLTSADQQRLADTISNGPQILHDLTEKSGELSRAKTNHASHAAALSELSTEISALALQAEPTERVNLIDQIYDLKSRVQTLETRVETGATELSENLAQLTALQTKADNLQTDIQTLEQESQTAGVQTQAVLTSLGDIEVRLETLRDKIADIAVPPLTQPSEISALETSFLRLKTQLETPPKDVDTPPNPDSQTTISQTPETPTGLNWPVLIPIIAAVLALLLLVAKFFLSPKVNARPSKSILFQTASQGVIFPASPMLAGNVAAPLAPAGQLAAAQLQMLSGPYAVLKDAYLATGRIGYAQDGIPSAEDYSFGTGFLVSERHVMTNRHVHGLYGHYLLDKSDPGGIEFMAEKDKDASDFIPFNGEPPLLLPELDIAIYTLSRAVTNRAPIVLNPIETPKLLATDVVVIGYPDTHTPDKAEVLAVVEDNPVFAVKRISQGQIFRHSTDREDPFGVETSVSETNSSSFIMPAICHNASTLGGNSGSPLLDLKNGRLIGVHFAGFKVFNQEEAANLAMAIAQITQSEALKNLPSVTPVTTNTNKIS